MRGWEVKTYHGDRNLNDKIAQILGIKIAEYNYKSLTEGQSTIFTAPPQFDTDSWSVNYLKNYAKEHNITLIDSNDPKLVALDFVEIFGN